MPQERLTRRVFDWDYDQACLGHKTWCKDVRDVMMRADAEHIFLSRIPERNLDLLQQKLISAYNIQWRARVEEMPKLRTYKLLKSVPGRETYVDLPPVHRKTLVRFRAGVYPLEIERGRWRGRPVDTRPL